MKKVNLIIGIVLFVGLLFFICFQNKSYIVFENELKTADIDDTPNKKQIDFVEKNKSKKDEGTYNIIGSIKINGTNINNTLVQGDDNEYYLNHSENNIKNLEGSIFVDYRNTFEDRKILIYGHNSRTLKTALFHDLEKYLKESFYKKNKYIELVLRNEKTKWEIFSVMIVSHNDNRHMKITFNDREYIEHLSWLKKASIYDTKVNVDVNDKIITLQTCYYKPANSFLIINAKKIK